MALVTSSRPIPIGDAAPPPVSPAMDRPKAPPRNVPKPRAIQRPRAIAKVVTKASSVANHYKPRGR